MTSLWEQDLVFGVRKNYCFIVIVNFATEQYRKDTLIPRRNFKKERFRWHFDVVEPWGLKKQQEQKPTRIIFIAIHELDGVNLLTGRLLRHLRKKRAINSRDNLFKKWSWRVEIRFRDFINSLPFLFLGLTSPPPITPSLVLTISPKKIAFTLKASVLPKSLKTVITTLHTDLLHCCSSFVE